MLQQIGARWRLIAFFLLFMAPPFASAAGVGDNTAIDDKILLEAEHFADYGGWLHDSQFMDQMGSPFLLAHGLGVPVKDAVTTLKAEPGQYRVWVRTRDWVADWDAKGAPGRFQLLMDGKPLETVFGTEGREWHWQDGGSVMIAQAEVPVALHDLTGFAGRCDAILLSRDLDFVPPNDGPSLSELRRQLLGFPETPELAGEFDLVVVGGGIAGTCAAISAARNGVKVALIQDRPVLGGNNSSEVRVWLQGARNLEPYPNVGNVVAELEQKNAAHYGPANTADLYEDERKLDLVRAEKNITLVLECRVNDVVMDGNKIVGVIGQATRTGRNDRFDGRLFADCTGDGCLGFIAGADHEVTYDGHMGPCNLWNAVETDSASPFPRCPWAFDLTDKPFPGRANADVMQLGGWYWESGFYHDPIGNAEYIRDTNFRAAYGAWDALKNVDQALPNHQLNWMAHIAGKRESRRLMGDIVLSKEDLLESVKFDDSAVPTGWPIDLHLPDPRYDKGFEGDEFIAVAHYTQYQRPYWVPYRCFYSRNIDNLFMAGRNISVTHEALGATRVMRTGGCMGEIVGMAASLCVENDTTPRGVYQNHLAELKALMVQGVPHSPDFVPVLTTTHSNSAKIVVKPPEWLKTAGENFAPKAKVTVSAETRSGLVAYLHDKRYDVNDNAARWVSESSREPIAVDFAWETPVTVNTMRVISGYHDGSRLVGAVNGYVLQYLRNGQWVDVPDAKVTDNTAYDSSQKFGQVTVSQLRLLITKTQDNIARLWEIEFYQQP
ncbi:MAG: FAD-dependent oxidoreductase [Planctomycetaceae bacterium]|nr:FAD-dependent oxidoreductase [Planctomycetaceae bacterium]